MRATEDLIESRIGVHDSNHFEVKLDYCLDSTRARTDYKVECYLFVPRGLGINRHSYPRTQFYSDVQGHIRFKTPVIGLRTLADAGDPLSPLGTVDSSIEALRHDLHNVELRRRLGHELRMFGCIARAQLRDRTVALRKAIHGLSNGRGGEVEDVRVLVQRLLADVTVLLGAWRQRRVEFLSGELPSVVSETYACTDEYLSQILEHRLTNLVAELGAHEQLADVRARLCEELLAERSYRKSCGYLDVDSGDRESYAYRRSMLKKLVTSVLWLEISKQKDGRGLGNFVAAIAAGAAMAFALLAALFGTRMGFVSNTWGFVLAGTVTYMFKDRIKEWVRGFLSSQTGRWMADYATEIHDPVSGREIGRCRESFNYVEAHAIPQEVWALRHMDNPSEVQIQAKPEVVIKYERAVRLSSASVIDRLHLADYEINDIMRFCVSHFLVRADDPVVRVPIYDPQTDAVVRREFLKTYHVNLVMVMRSATTAPMLKRIRVVFDKRGIRRLDRF
jgi:hypothetical protein